MRNAVYTRDVNANVWVNTARLINGGPSDVPEGSTFQGCFTDSSSRKLPFGGGVDVCGADYAAVKKACMELAKGEGFHLFALQAPLFELHGFWIRSVGYCMDFWYVVYYPLVNSYELILSQKFLSVNSSM